MKLTVNCDHCGGHGEVPARIGGDPDKATCDVATCGVCLGESTRAVELDVRDPWAVLDALRRRPLVAAATDDERRYDIHGSAAVDELAELRAVLDAALAHRPEASQTGRDR